MMSSQSPKTIRMGNSNTKTRNQTNCSTNMECGTTMMTMYTNVNWKKEKMGKKLRGEVDVSHNLMSFCGVDFPGCSLQSSASKMSIWQKLTELEVSSKLSNQEDLEKEDEGQIKMKTTSMTGLKEIQ